MPAIMQPLDLAHLAQYTLGNRDLEAELLGLFRAQAQLYLDRLSDATDDKEWRDAAHSLKGSARGLGAFALGDIAEEAERLADQTARASMIEHLRAAVAEVNLYIDEVVG
ncbi:MAG: Hpt domain-containing protein [Parvibaculum sedimenti]|uniref:Hpt domain-containing protein n=1 Tax=Parvibaculum sedimenti TaxID=2608632 RepID=UPI003BB665A7